MATGAKSIIKNLPPLELEKEFYSITETVELLGCSRPMLYKWIEEGEFQPYRKAATRNRIIPSAQIIDFLERYKDVPPEGHFCAYELENGEICTQRIRIEAEYCWMHGNEIAEAGVLESLTESKPDFLYPNLPDVVEDDQQKRLPAHD